MLYEAMAIFLAALAPIFTLTQARVSSKKYWEYIASKERDDHQYDEFHRLLTRESWLSFGVMWCLTISILINTATTIPELSAGPALPLFKYCLIDTSVCLLVSLFTVRFYRL